MKKIQSFLLVVVHLILNQTSVFAAWSSPPLDVNSSIITSSPAVAVSDFNDEALGFWVNYASFNILQFGVLPPNGTAWVLTSPPAGYSGGNSNLMQLKIDPNGNAVAVWLDTSISRVVASVRPQSTATWSPTTVLGVPGVRFANISVAISDAGDAVVAWGQGASTTLTDIFAAKYIKSTDLWLSTVSVESGVSFDRVSVDLDAAGNAVLIYNSIDPSAATVRWSTSAVSTNTWLTPQNIFSPTSDLVLSPDMKCDDAGNAVAVWCRGPSTNLVVQSAKLPFGNPAWISATANLSGISATESRVAVERSNGNALAIWHRSGAGGGIESAWVPLLSNTWISLSSFSSTLAAASINLDMDATGNAVASWIITGPGSVVQASSYSKSTTSWGGISTISNPNVVGLSLTLSVNSAGNAIAGWEGNNNHGNTSSLNEQVTSAIFSTVTAFPTTVEADGTSQSTITVTLLDASSTPVPGHAVSLAAGSGSSLISAPSGVSNASGEVTFTVTNTAVQNVTYTATDTTNSVVISQTATVGFTALVTDVGISQVAASPSSVEADGVETSTITVTLLNAANVPVPGHIVSLTAGSGNSVISAPSGVSNASGVVTFTVTNTFVQNVTYTATDTTDDVIITPTATVNFIPRVTNSTESTKTATPSSVLANGVGTSTITIALKNANGVAVPGHTVSLVAGSGSSFISPLTTTSNASGIATFTVTDTVAETVTYTATDTTNTVIIRPLENLNVTFTTPETSAGRSTVVATPAIVPDDGTTPATITVTLLDEDDVPLVGHTVNLTQGSGSSVISAPSGPSTGSGVVTFTVTNIFNESVEYTAVDTTDSVTINQKVTVGFGNQQPEPPSSFGGSITKNKFVTQTETMNVLTWSPSPDPTTVGYRIYSKGVLVYETGSQPPFRVVLHNRQKTESYTLVAVAANGLESTPLTLSVE